MAVLILNCLLAYGFGWLCGFVTAIDSRKQIRRRKPRQPAPPAVSRSGYDWRRRINHENRNAPTGAPPLLWQPLPRRRGSQTIPPPREP